jgi:hypothetical protein
MKKFYRYLFFFILLFHTVGEGLTYFIVNSAFICQSFYFLKANLKKNLNKIIRVAKGINYR